MGNRPIRITYLVLFIALMWQYSPAAITDLPIEFSESLNLLTVLRFCFKSDCFGAMMDSLSSVLLQFVQKQKNKNISNFAKKQTFSQL